MAFDFCTKYNIPSAMIPHLLEIFQVKYGIKLGCRITIDSGDLHCVTSFLNAHKLKYLILFQSKTEDAFLQYNSTTRFSLLKKENLYLYVAKNSSDAKSLFKTDALQKEYEKFGALLGYPGCCIDFARENDKIFIDHLGVKRQANLCLAALKRTTSVDYRCNNFIAGSFVAEYNPLNVFSHYPCSYSCTHTIAIAEQNIKLITKIFPHYHDRLIELLNFNILYWSDEVLDVKHISEFNGIALKGAKYFENLNEISNVSYSINLRNTLFFKDLTVLDINKIKFYHQHFCVEQHVGSQSYFLTTPSYFLDWDLHKIYKDCQKTTVLI